MKQQQLVLIMNFKVILFLLISLFRLEPAQSVARTIKLPLIRGTTPTAGQYGQPVISYYTKVNIGTPAKEFLIQFDVNLDDPFVPHYTWSPFKINLHYGKGFQCKYSSTCSRDERELSILYQNCKLTGKPYSDVMTLPMAFGSNGTLANNSSNAISFRQKFLAISDASDARFKDLPIDGYFGLSPAAQSASGSAIENLLIVLHKSKLIDNLQFSFWFNPILDSTQGGELVLGGVDESRYQGQMFWHHLTNNISPTEWSLALQYVSLANRVFSCASESCQAVISSGVNEIFGPERDVLSLYAQLGARKSSNNLRVVDCQRVSQLPYLTFTIDGIPYVLLPSNYIRKSSSGECYVAVLPSMEPARGGKRWLLGTNFLGAYYSTYDATYKQVGFASLR